MQVKEVMSVPAETISSESTVAQAAEKMRVCDVGVLPILKNNRIVGLVTDRDIVVRAVAEKCDAKRTPVSKIMTSDPVCCSAEMSMEQAVQLMEDRQVHRLVVLGSGGSICGMLSIGDIAVKMKDEHILHEVLEHICQPVY